jgi:hypothetical protein
MKSSVSGSSSGSSSDGSSSSDSGSSKTSTDKNFGGFGGGSSDSAKTGDSADKALSSAAETTGPASDSYDEATKALSLALANFQVALLKTKKQPLNGQFPETGTQHAKPQAEGADSVNGKPQEADYQQEVKAKHPMPKGDTGSTDNVNGKPQEPDYNSMESDPASGGSSLGKSMANQAQFVKSIDQLSALMQKLGEKVESVEGKVESLPGVRKGIAIDKQFTEEEKEEFAKNEQARKKIEADLLADPRADFKTIHQYRTYGAVPAWYSQPK